MGKNTNTSKPNTDRDSDVEVGLLLTERTELIDTLANEVRFRFESAEELARMTAVELLDITTALLVEFVGTAEFNEAKAVVDARLRSKLATVSVKATNEARDMVRQFALALVLGARTFVVGRIAP